LCIDFSNGEANNFHKGEEDSMAKLRKRELPAEDFQMAPMIEMVFLLLVFFMCVSNLAQADKSIPLELPESDESRIPEVLADRGTISIDLEGTAYISGAVVSIDELKERIGSALRSNPEMQIFVRADQATLYSDIQAVLKACASVGAYEIIYATYQSH